MCGVGLDSWPLFNMSSNNNYWVGEASKRTHIATKRALRKRADLCGTLHDLFLH